jgi:two-component system, chemotaxis family, CheB/CheR fusion protein
VAFRLTGSPLMTVPPNNNEEQIFEDLLEYLRRVRGFDFRGYKRSSLQRRVRRQMQIHDLQAFSDYFDYLQVHPEEFYPLFNTILINVTSFFRDASAWKCLQNKIIPHLIRQKSDADPIRVWSAGCASGEEAYTLAIILAEALKPEAFRQRVKIYATDVDDDALTQARQTNYSERDLQPLPVELRDRYFEPIGNRYVFRPDLRRAVIFGRHDLVQDAPIPRLDLLVCRNTLMYFNAETQAKILNRFHFALKDTGVLFLGKAEMLLTHTNLFIPISLQHRIFQRTLKPNWNERLLTVPQASFNDEENDVYLDDTANLYEAAFDTVPVAQLIVDLNGKLVLANSMARSLLEINVLDLGRSLQDLEISYRPLDLRSPIEQVWREQKTIIVNDVARNQRDGTTQYLDVQFNLLEDNNGERTGVSITFTDVSRSHALQGELQRTNQELETANEELQSSNEELETTNEELQSTNEELETTNEELQSTNEELETMNEELQSTNEELQTINDELRQRTTDLNQVNAFLNSILTSLQTGVIVVDQQLNILSWNDETEDLWGLRADEVQGQSLLSLDIGLPIDYLREPIRNCLAGTVDRQEIILESINRRGRTFQCRVSYTPLMGYDRDRQGVILLMEEVDA